MTFLTFTLFPHYKTNIATILLTSPKKVCKIWCCVLYMIKRP